jgi:hypothetical protein
LDVIDSQGVDTFELDMSSVVSFDYTIKGIDTIGLDT